MIKQNGYEGGTYIEPFAGGAGVALELLAKGVVTQIVINDSDRGIYSFWKAVLDETDRFINKIKQIPLNITEYNKQRKIYLSKSENYNFSLGFATFYLNRTNISGVIQGG